MLPLSNKITLSSIDNSAKLEIQKNNIIVHVQIGGSCEDNIYIEFITGSKALLKFTEGLRDLLSFEDAY